jgi:hypothetical protein
MPERFLHDCHARGGNELEPIEHIMLICPSWECNRRDFWTLAHEFNRFVRQFATSPKMYMPYC